MQGDGQIHTDMGWTDKVDAVYIDGLPVAEYVRKYSPENGAVRVIIDPAASSARMLQKGDSVYFHYSGYIFSGGKGSLFATNDSEVAEAAGFITDGNPFNIKYGSSALLEGLRLGLEGVQEGEHCYIIFSARYGYGNQIMANLPKLTPLLFEITVDKIF